MAEVQLKRAADEVPEPCVPVIGLLLDGTWDTVYWSKGVNGWMTTRGSAPADKVIYWHTTLPMPRELHEFLQHKAALLLNTMRKAAA